MRRVRRAVYRAMLAMSVICCVLFTLEVLLNRQILYFEDNMIFVENIELPYPPLTKSIEVPKIIHQTWKSGQIPNKFSKWIQSWRKNHPDWQYWFWTDEDCLRLIKERYPMFLDLYQSYPENINRADIIRYFILYEFGGIYVDLDMESSQSLDSLLTVDAYAPCFLSQEPVEHARWLWKVDHIACNAVMACRRRHPFFANVLEQLKFQKGTSLFMFVKANRAVMYATGPLMITDLFNAYNETMSILDPFNRIHLVPPHYFYPTIDPNVMDVVKKYCLESNGVKLSKLEKTICERHRTTMFSNEPVSGFYGNHHWVHTYYSKEKGQTSDIKDIIKDVKLANEMF